LSKKLYPEQQQAREIANKFLNKKINSAYIAPCGTGKTLTTTRIIEDRIKLNQTIFVLVPQIEIHGQWLEELSEHGLNPGYVNDEGIRGANRKVYVCMFQSLIGILNLIDKNIYPDVIVVDEMQHLLSPTIKSICDFFHNATILGLTATLYHISGETFRPYIQETFQTITKKMAIEKGYITESILIEPKNYLKDFEIPILDENYDMKKQARLLGKTTIYGDMVNDYERLFNGRPVIVPCATFEQANLIKEIFCKAGWNFEHVHSEGMPKHERKRILKGIDNQSINGLSTVGIGVEGLSIKGLWGVLWACRTESPIRWTQFIGRGERLYQGKKYCIIVDYTGNAIIHGHPSSERKWTLDGEEIKDQDTNETPFTVCPDCGVYNSIENTNCHWCNADLTEDGKKEGTCRRCKNWKKGECILFCHCPLWLMLPGCPSYQKRGRSLPTVVDGELIAVTTDGQLHEIQSRTDKAKKEIQEEIKKEKEEKAKLETIDIFEKRKIIQKGLFANGIRRSLFEEALRG